MQLAPCWFQCSCRLPSSPGSAEPVKRDFESDAVGAPPVGFDFARTGGGAEGNGSFAWRRAQPPTTCWCRRARTRLTIVSPGGPEAGHLQGRRAQRPRAAVVRQGRSGLRSRLALPGCQQLLRDAVQRRRGQLHDLPHGRRAAAPVPEQEREGRQERLAHAEARGLRRPLRRDFRRQRRPRREDSRSRKPARSGSGPRRTP